MAADEQQKGPRETAAGLETDGRTKQPPPEGAPAEGEVNPETQENMIDDRSSPDEQSIRAKSQTGKQVTADKWNQ